MDYMSLISALAAGTIAAVVFGSISGLIIGKEALGAQLAAFMGGFYGMLSGVGATLLGLIIYTVQLGAI